MQHVAYIDDRLLKKKTAIPKTIWLLGGMMLFVNCSFAMITSFLGIYLREELGISTTWIGFMEGATEGLNYIMKMASGVFCDFFGYHKTLMLVGGGLCILSRPLLSVATFFPTVFLSRILDRVGNGIQATPRDVLVFNDTVDSSGSANYGLLRAFGAVGFVVGGLLGIWGMIWTCDNYQKVLWLSLIPTVLSFITLVFFVLKSEEKPSKKPCLKDIPVFWRWSSITFLGKPFWLLMIVTAVYCLSRMSETFIILHAYINFGLAKTYAPFVTILFYGSWGICAYPAGVLMERIDGYRLFGLGILFIIAANVIFVVAPSLNILFLGVILWGVQYGIVQTVLVSLVVKETPQHLTGTAIGTYCVVGAIATFFSDTGAGFIAEHHGEWTVFVVSGMIACISLIILGYVAQKRRAVTRL